MLALDLDAQEMGRYTEIERMKREDGGHEGLEICLDIIH